MISTNYLMTQNRDLILITPGTTMALPSNVHANSGGKGLIKSGEISAAMQIIGPTLGDPSKLGLRRIHLTKQ